MYLWLCMLALQSFSFLALSLPIRYKMTFFAQNEEWIGYLSEIIVQKCVSLSLVDCPGCKDKMKSDLLHLHNQQSLLQKLQNYFEPARADVLNSLTNHYKAIAEKLPHSDDKKKDMMIYCNLGRQFLITCSPEAMYYGRYINQTNDAFIDELLTEKKKGKAKNRSSVA